MYHPARRLFIKRLSLLVAGALLLGLTLIAFDIVFSPYRRLPFNGFVDGKRYTWGHLVRNNKYGFRERNFENPKPMGTYRVMVLGDSLTWGAGLAVEERYTTIAEKLLTRDFPGRKIEVLNFALSGAPATKERDVLQRLHDEIKPDLIVVGFCLNDPQPRSQNYSIERERLSNRMIGRLIHQTSQALADLGLLYTAKLINDGFYRSAERFGLIPSWQVALARVYDPGSHEWQEFVQALRDIKTMSDEMNLPAPIFAVLNTGVSRIEDGDSAPKPTLQSQWFHQAEKAAADSGFVSYNHELEIAGHPRNQSLVINKMDGHPSASVNFIYGEKLYRAIANQLAQQS